jgi:hypothetical protein
MKNKTKKEGIALVTTLVLASTLALVLAGVASTISNSRFKTKDIKARTDLDIIAQSAQNMAVQKLYDYAMDKTTEKITYNNLIGSNHGKVFKDVATGGAESDPVSFFNSLTNINSSSDPNITKIIKDLNYIGKHSDSTGNNSGLPIKFETYYFYDKNGNFTKDTGEEGFDFLKDIDSVSVGKRQRAKFKVFMTTYVYRGNDFDSSDYRKKIVSSGYADLSSVKNSFAHWGLYMKSSTGVWFGEADLNDGPVYSQGVPNFHSTTPGNGPQFLEGFDTSATSVNLWGSGSVDLNATYGTGPKTIPGVASGTVTPNFGAVGLKYGAPLIPLPDNATSQQRAALGGDPNNLTVPTSADIAAAVGTTNPPPNGVYLPQSGSVLNGGIYVKGNATVDLATVPSGLGYNNQVYTIQTGTDKKVITVDATTNQTVVQQIDTSTSAVMSTNTYTGKPNGSFYVDGDISSIKGPPRATGSTDPGTAAPAIAAATQLTISANSIKIGGDIKYEIDPRGPVIAPETKPKFGDGNDLPNTTNVLGLFASTGNVTIGMPNPPANTNINGHNEFYDINIHAVIMAPKGTFTVDSLSSRTRSGSINQLGGQIVQDLGATEPMGSAKGFGTATVYDRRMKDKELEPPFFPTQTKPDALPPKIVIEATKEFFTKEG